MRALGHVVRKLKILVRALVQLLREPTSLSENTTKLLHAWRSGGVPALKAAAINVQHSPALIEAWRAYRLMFSEQVKPQIIRRIADMAATPTISIIVPTYNTPDTLLREMLDSVMAQLYPHWELCIADDGDRKSTRLNSSHLRLSRMPSSA